MPNEAPRDDSLDEVDKRNARDWFKVRKYVVRLIRDEKKTMTQTANCAGVSVGFVHKWWHRWLESKHWDSLRSRSSQPHHMHMKRYRYAVEVVDLKRQHPLLGVQKLTQLLKVEKNADISHMSVYRVLVDEGELNAGPKAQRIWRAFERKHSNSLWQCDILDVDDTKTAFLVSFIDDHSRMIVASKVVASATTEAIVDVFRKAVRMFGAPRQVLTDHGTQFFFNKTGIATSFGSFCEERGIKHILAGVRKPTTCGKIERWHRSFRQECLFLAKSQDNHLLRWYLPIWLDFYNNSRPHFALDLRSPMEVYFADLKSNDGIIDFADFHEVC
jgi:transposase InsO family protein